MSGESTRRRRAGAPSGSVAGTTAVGGDPNARHAEAGFTLIELLVAMFLLAVLGTAGFQMLFQINATREGIERQSERMTSLQRTFYWMAEDVTQIVDRPVRSAVGSALPALFLDISGEPSFELTRGGWTNPAEDIMPPRSSLQRVAWTLEDDKLVRSYWYHLEPVDEAPTRRRQLLDGVEALTLRFLDVEGEWRDSWPPTGEENPGLPSALEITLALADLGDVVRVFALPR